MTKRPVSKPVWKPTAGMPSRVARSVLDPMLLGGSGPRLGTSMCKLLLAFSRADLQAWKREWFGCLDSYNETSVEGMSPECMDWFPFPQRY